MVKKNQNIKSKDIKRDIESINKSETDNTYIEKIINESQENISITIDYDLNNLESEKEFIIENNDVLFKQEFKKINELSNTEFRFYQKTGILPKK